MPHLSEMVEGDLRQHVKSLIGKKITDIKLNFCGRGVYFVIYGPRKKILMEIEVDNTFDNDGMRFIYDGIKEVPKKHR
jgi:hypothetical protein